MSVHYQELHVNTPVLTLSGATTVNVVKDMHLTWIRFLVEVCKVISMDM